jgi:hypothetical protein
LLGSFTYPKVGTWGRLFDFPSEGRHTECTISLKAAVLPGLKSGRALVKKKKKKKKAC